MSDYVERESLKIRIHKKFNTTNFIGFKSSFRKSFKAHLTESLQGFKRSRELLYNELGAFSSCVAPVTWLLSWSSLPVMLFILVPLLPAWEEREKKRILKRTRKLAEHLIRIFIINKILKIINIYKEIVHCYVDNIFENFESFSFIS